MYATFRKIVIFFYFFIAVEERGGLICILQSSIDIRRGGTAVAQTPSVPLLGGRNPCGLPFAAKRQNDRGEGCHYNVKERLSFAERLDLSARFQYIICRVRACVNTNMVYKLYKDMVYTFISVKMSFGVLDAG